MAAKGGGAWKVAYADFVTAMMAFFLVMWICAQDQKIKQAVARYFVNPMGIVSLGASKKPDRTGAVFDHPSSGSVPKAESIELGRGRNSYTYQGESSLATKLVADWLQTDKEATAYWRKQAQRQRELASTAREVLDKSSTPERAAAMQLARHLEQELTRKIPSQATGLYQDLLFGALSRINWIELAEDLLAN